MPLCTGFMAPAQKIWTTQLLAWLYLLSFSFLYFRLLPFLPWPLCERQGHGLVATLFFHHSVTSNWREKNKHVCNWIRNAGCLNAEMLKYQNAKILIYWNAEMLNCWNAEIMKQWHYKIMKYWLEMAGNGGKWLELAWIGHGLCRFGPCFFFMELYDSF